MRDVKQITNILVKLRKIWERSPDLRLGQLLMIGAKDKDIFYLEDEELIQMAEASITRPSEKYFDDFMAYLNLSTFPKKEDVPIKPENLTEEEAREIRWNAYRYFKTHPNKITEEIS